MKLTSLAPDINHRVLICGLPGTGKTTLAASLSEEFDLLWIDLENAVDTLLKLPIPWQERIEVIRIPDSASYPVASDTLMTLFKDGKANICCAHGKVNCAICKRDGAEFTSVDFSTLTSQDIVVLDTGTQLSHSILAHTMRNKAVTDKPERDDWGALRKYTEFFASQFQAAKFNLIVICHSIETSMEDGRMKLVPNFGSQSMSAEFGKFFSDVIYCDVKNRKHIANSASTFSNTVLTKSRTDFMIENLPVPSLIPLFRNDHLSKEEKAAEVKAIERATPAVAATSNLLERLKQQREGAAK